MKGAALPMVSSMRTCVGGKVVSCTTAITRPTAAHHGADGACARRVRDSIDRTRTRLHVDSVDLAPGSVRLVHADSQQALVSMAEMWAKAGGAASC